MQSQTTHVVATLSQRGVDKDEGNDFGINEIFIDCIFDSIVNAHKNDQAFVKLYRGHDSKHVKF